MQSLKLPRFQYTIRELSGGARFLAYSNELSKTYATLAVERFLRHLRDHGIDTAEITITTDLGSEFDGDTVHYRPERFHLTIERRYGAKHRFNPPPARTPMRMSKASTPTSKRSSSTPKPLTTTATSSPRSAPASFDTTSPAKTAPVAPRSRWRCWPSKTRTAPRKSPRRSSCRWTSHANGCPFTFLYVMTSLSCTSK